MSENTQNPLTDFLAMEENDSGMFADIPFHTSVTPQTVVPSASPQPQASVVQRVIQMPQAPSEESAPVQNTLFAEALAQTPAAANPTANNTAQSIADAPDPFTAALANAKAQSDNRLVEGCASRDAVFSYGKAKEPITDRDCTFEDLREKYESDFPELSDSKRVSWTVTYGKETKTINNPGSDKVYDIKAEIEKSKKFLDGIKNAKSEADKNPECFVKPYIKAQSKGEVISLSSYKEFCTTEVEAQESKKAIVLLPSSDGRLYQVRKTPVGIFIAQADHLPEFPAIDTGFQMTLPKIPMHILMFIWDFFCRFVREIRVRGFGTHSLRHKTRKIHDTSAETEVNPRKCRLGYGGRIS